jgi:integrase/recombinase XerD
MSRRGHCKKGPKATGDRLAIALWPAPDRELWAAAQKGGSVLARGGRAAKWQPRTAHNVERAYGEWLNWVTLNDVELLRLTPFDRVTRARVKLYMDSLPKTLSPSTVQMRLQRLGQMMTAVSGSKDFVWLFQAANRLRPVSVRNKRAKIQPTYKLVDLGFKLMAEARDLRPSWHRPPATLYRNGLIIALLAYWPIRLGNLTSIEIGRHLLQCGDGFRLAFSADETKQGRDIAFDLPANLSAAVGEYLDTYRPVLMTLGGHQDTAGQALWVSRDGGPMTPSGIAGTIERHTKVAFGAAINPHLFRDCAATTIAIDDPGHAEIIAHVLGHSSMITSELHYNQAGSIEAGGQYQAVLDARRRYLRGAASRRPT